MLVHMQPHSVCLLRVPVDEHRLGTCRAPAGKYASIVG
jgi:hypothetical protein